MNRVALTLFLLFAMCTCCLANGISLECFDTADSGLVPEEAAGPGKMVIYKATRSLKLPCNFREGDRRARWDREVKLDLSGIDQFSIRIRLENLIAIDHISLHFKSGDGWYTNGNLVPINSEEWQQAVFSRNSFGEEGTCAGWDKISAVRISVWKQTNAKASVELSDFKAGYTGKTDNLLSNSSYETCSIDNMPDYWGTGHFGFTAVDWVHRMDEWHKMWTTDNTSSRTGSRSLKITGSTSTQGLEVYSCFAYPRNGNTEHTFSAWIKSDTADMSVSMQFSGSKTEVFTVPGDNTWRRYWVTGMPADAFGEANQYKTWCIITPKARGNIWIDDAQFEIGNKPTDYTPAVSDASITGKVIQRTVKSRPDQKIVPIKGNNSVNIDANGRFTLNGKPYIPFAIGWESIPTKNTLESMARSGFNTVCFTIYPWNYTELASTLDIAQSCGLMAIPWINHGVTVDILKQLISDNKDHPALLAWYVSDEPGSINSEVVSKYELAKSIDPNHPAYINFSILFADYTFGDIASMDRYPLPRNSPAVMYLDAEAMSNVASANNKPAWIWLQNCGNIAWMSREPSAPEMECMTYISLVHGVRGFKYYAHRSHSENLWNQLKQLAYEIKTLTPVVYSLETPPDVISSPGSIHVVTRKYNGKTYIITVNERPSPVSASFKLKSVSAKRASVLFENRTVPIGSKVIKDTFSGYQRHVYCID